MKTTFLLVVLVACVFYYFHDSVTPTLAVEKDIPAQAVRLTAANGIVIAPAPSYCDRWITGPNAQTALKTGPNAQTDFAPFPPSEQATWNETPGYSIVSSPKLRIH